MSALSECSKASFEGLPDRTKRAGRSPWSRDHTGTTRPAFFPALPRRSLSLHVAQAPAIPRYSHKSTHHRAPLKFPCVSANKQP